MAEPRPCLWLVLWSLLISLFLSALDSTIVATALPTIVGDLGDLDHIAWVFTAYLLTSTVSVPLFGKVSDIYSALFSVAVTTLLLGATWGGTKYPWTSPLIIGLLSSGVVLSLLFLLQERRAEEPLLPLRLFKNDVFSVCVVLGVLFGSVMVIASVFLPLFLQIVRGVSATNSGYLLVPMMGGVLVGSTCGGRLITRTGRYKPMTIAGGLLSIAGIGMLARIDVDSSRTFVSIGMAILGLGVGTSSPVMTLAVQNVAAKADMGAATSAVNFFRSLGSAFGVALFGSIQSARFHAVLAAQLPAGSFATNP